jgi:hypothetical protein
VGSIPTRASNFYLQPGDERPGPVLHSGYESATGAFPTVRLA